MPEGSIHCVIENASIRSLKDKMVVEGIDVETKVNRIFFTQLVGLNAKTINLLDGSVVRIKSYRPGKWISDLLDKHANVLRNIDVKEIVYRT